MGLFSAFQTSPPKTPLEEVLLAISHLLSTKNSFGAWQKGLGLHDYSEVNQSKQVLTSIAEDIARNLNEYEKRFVLDNIDVAYFKSFSDFAFVLSGELYGVMQKIYIHISKKRGINVTTEA